MKSFTCPSCAHPLYFENKQCTHCSTVVGFDPQQMTFVEIGSSDGKTLLCANSDQEVCNWLAQTPPAADQIGRPFCQACARNSTIPDIELAENHQAWSVLEEAKHRLIYSLLQLGIPFDEAGLQKCGCPDHAPLNFHFMADETTGHLDGDITISLEEADPLERTRQREELGELYRTPLGHLRHEAGHYVFSLLATQESWLSAFRQLFGDERADYAEAMAAHYEGETGKNWTDNYVSAYASMHPHEDWAESFAHVLHMVDVLETSRAVSICAQTGSQQEISPQYDPYHLDDWQAIQTDFVDLTLFLNELNRSMGHEDFYAFVITPAVSEKMAFVWKSLRDFFAISNDQSVQTSSSALARQ